jgi:prepilin-type N-terminal cleavage/methylation domain-containing protein
MKVLLFNAANRPLATTARRAFTLTEVMVASAVFSLAIIGVIYSHLFGLRMQGITQSKLASTENARFALNRVKDEIRTAKTVAVGDGNGASFTEVPIGQVQVGNAVQIYATTNTNSFVRYFLDDNADALKRYDSASKQTETVAGYVTNSVVFRAEDYRGNTLTNSQDNRVIRMTLEFYRLQYPLVKIGPGNLYDYYRLQTRITRRAID